MRNRMLRSVLVAAFSAVAALGVLGGFSGAKDDVRANSVWPSVAVGADAGSTDGVTSGSGAEGAGS
jgi:hypothetical protein